MSPATSTNALPALVDVPNFCREQGRYRVRFAHARDELDAILRLRFEVFNLEMGEGLEASYATERDEDGFDAWCHHLLVEETGSGEVIGTYRMQTPEMALANGGFYSSGEFCVEQLPDVMLASSVEAGRASIAKDHRSHRVLFLLWKGMGAYMRAFGKRYLFGCCSLSSQDPAEGVVLHRQLEAQSYLHPRVRVDPRPGLECVVAEGQSLPAKVVLPQLFGIYLRHGGHVLGPPAIDREFKTIDYFLINDSKTLDSRTYELFFG